MDSSEENQQTQPFFPKSKPFAFYLLPILVLFLAISFSFTKTNYIKIQYLKYTLSPHNLFQALSGFLHTTLKWEKAKQGQPTNPVPSYCVLWMAPFLSGGGYSSEGWSYILALHEHMKKPSFKLAIEHHGDQESVEFWEGLPQNIKNMALELYQTECRMNETVVVCHSEPGAWYPPLFETFPCPPSVYQNFKYVIGRTMFETDRVNPEHVRRCNQMDYVWVPTEFHVSTFIQSGIDPSKVVKIVQPIDVEFFDPFKYKPLDLVSLGKLVIGTNTIALNAGLEKFVFLSVFKWEYRKGWDVLLKAYLKEFAKVDGVALYLLTNPYHTDRDFGNKILEFVEDSGIEEPASGWAPIYVVDTHIAQTDLPRIYKAANAFVLPSRGEGWGRPLVEAMAMSVPVIATNWSGPTEYLSCNNSYPLSVDRMSEVAEGPFKGHLWAEPSVDKLRLLMRHVIDNPIEAKAKGRQGREDMIRRFSPEIVADIVNSHIKHILQDKN
ncbi:Glycosyl transferase family 1 protein [Quillaja saponaria]|uniref:Glycosyl transferase family 1 protein n=1 Tax=Quillaja saponaria TaxID=32244 RepID=A0AAD7VGA2_QUISA|nr:Glycosyl transferase family 1 protein [Quillaja saponaria]